MDSCSLECEVLETKQLESFLCSYVHEVAQGLI